MAEKCKKKTKKEMKTRTGVKYTLLTFCSRTSTCNHLELVTTAHKWPPFQNTKNVLSQSLTLKPLVSDHQAFAFWVFAHGRLNCIFFDWLGHLKWQPCDVIGPWVKSLKFTFNRVVKSSWLRRKSPPTWLVTASYSAWHFFTDGIF